MNSSAPNPGPGASDSWARSEEQVRQQLAELEAIYDTAPLGFCVLDRECRYRRINNLLARINGLPAAEHIGRSVREILPGIADQAETALQRVLTTGEPFRFELQGVTEAMPNVTRIWDERWYPLRDAAGNIIGVGVVAEDVTEHRRTEHAFREGEATLRAMFDVSSFGIAQAEIPSRRLVRVNAAFCATTGYTEAELLQMTVDQLNHPDDAAKDAEDFGRVLRGEATQYQTEKRYLRKDGRVIWVQATGNVIRDADGQPIRAFATVRDITERKQAADQLQRERAFIEAVLQACPVGIIVADAAGKLVRMNPANERIWGRAPLSQSVEEYREWKGWWADGTPRDGAPLQPQDWAMSRALRGEFCPGDVVDIEPFDAPGTRRTIVNCGAPIRSDDGAILGAIIAQMDITARRQAEEALRESEERFRAMADNIAPLAWMANPDGWIFWYNQRWYEFTGTTLEQMQGWGWERVHHPDHCERVVKHWVAHLKRGEPWEDVFPLRRYDGQWAWFLSRAFPIRDEQANITRWFGTNTDITELRDTQEALRAAQEELRDHAANLERTVADRTAELRDTIGQLETFSYSITHDMRGPLRAMNSFAHLLAEEAGPRLTATEHDYLRRIREATKRMDGLIQDVLQYSKVAKSDLPPEPISLRRAIMDVLHQYPDIAERKQCIILDDRCATLEVHANASALSQVISNLLTNALKFVPRGLTPEVRIICEQRGATARLTVADNGIGIAPVYQQKIFGVFERLHTSEYSGTGVGLSIVKKAVERMGGTVGLESEPGKGSRFWVELPLAPR